MFLFYLNALQTNYTLNLSADIIGRINPFSETNETDQSSLVPP